MGPQPNDRVPTRRETDAVGKATWRRRWGLEFCGGLEPPGAGKAMWDSSLEPLPDRGPADTSTSNFRPPDRESVSFCCSGPWVGGDSLRLLWETNTLTNHGRFIGTQMSHERAHETRGRGGAIRRAALAGGVACSGTLGRCHSLGQRFESPRLPSRVGTAATSARHRRL